MRVVEAAIASFIDRSSALTLSYTVWLVLESRRGSLIASAEASRAIFSRDHSAEIFVSIAVRTRANPIHRAKFAPTRYFIGFGKNRQRSDVSLEAAFRTPGGSYDRTAVLHHKLYPVSLF